MQISHCSIKVSVSRFPLGKNQIIQEAREHLEKRGGKDTCFELEVVGEQRMKSLNNKYMSKDCPTDVLSFPLGQIPGEQNRLIGTIFVCHDIIKKQAVEKDVSYREEFLFIVKHGIDHLVGIHHK